MKKNISILLKVFAGLILLFAVVVIAVPVLFRDKIKAKVEQTINESVNAKVQFGAYKLGFFKNFPSLTFSLRDLSVTGTGKFESDTLTSIKSLDLVFNLKSIFSKAGYEISSINAGDMVVNTIVLSDGSANWDIMKETDETETASSAPSTMKILLKKVIVTNGLITYADESSAIRAALADVDVTLSGDMTLSETDLKSYITAGAVTFSMDGFKYLDRASGKADIRVLANLDSMKFTFKENYLDLNDFRVNFAGTVAMPGDDIATDIVFKSEKTDFKSLLSLIPALYMKDYQDIRAGGEFSLSGSARGIYSDADSTMPDVKLNLAVNNGLIAYPSLPEQIKNINVKADIFYDGRDADKTTVAVDPGHMELAGNPFDMTLYLKTPISDPDIKASMTGRIDLSSLKKALPIDSMDLSGIIDMSVKLAGRMSMIEKSQYSSFSASGGMKVKDMLVAMAGYPEVKINQAGLEFTPAYAALTQTNLTVARTSDFTLAGKLENYIPYMFSDKTLKGQLSLRSRLTDASAIMAAISGEESAEDTTALSVIQVPKNIDIDFDAFIDQLKYNKIDARQLKGHIIARNGVLSIRDAGMNLLGGMITMNADYDTRDTLKPSVKAGFGISSMGIKDAFTTFNTVQKLAPAAGGVDGNINMKFEYQSLLGRDMMPLINTITGNGKLMSDQVTLLSSNIFEKIKQTLKLGDKYTNTFKDINVSFKISDGRIFVSPFDVRTGNMKMNISGDQGIDQSLNYIVKTEIPRSDMGSSVNSLIDNLSAQAGSLGINFKPADVLKVNLSVTGTFLKPVISPFFGSSPAEGEGSGNTVKETVKEAAASAVDKAKSKAVEEAEARAADLVKEAELKGQKLREEAAAAAEKMRKEADVQAENLVKGAADKGALAKVAAQKSAEALRKTADSKATQLVKEADVQAVKLVTEARTKGDELISKVK